jgi:uncharacterized protein YpbB
MGILNKKGKADADGPLHFFDDYYREELRTKGREYFEKIIDDNASLFKKDLDALIVSTKGDIQEHIEKHLDSTLAQVNESITKQMANQLDDYAKKLNKVQDEALEKLEKRNKELEKQHEELSQKLQKNVADQEAMFVETYKQNVAKIAELHEAHGLALQMLNRSTQALEQQTQQLEALLQQGVAAQQQMLVSAFEQNMARVVEHYLLGALGDTFDLKAQLPAIIKQMEANKKDLVDDIKL